MQFGLRQQKHGFHRRVELAVHRRHLCFVIEVGQVADATHHGTGALLATEVHDQAIERQHADATWGDRHDFGGHVHALLQTEAGLFVVGHGHRDDDFVEQRRRAARHVFVAQRHGIESAAVHRDARWLASRGRLKVHAGIMREGSRSASLHRQQPQQVKGHLARLALAVQLQTELSQFVGAPAARGFQVNHPVAL